MVRTHESNLMPLTQSMPTLPLPLDKIFVLETCWHVPRAQVSGALPPASLVGTNHQPHAIRLWDPDWVLAGG